MLVLFCSYINIDINVTGCRRYMFKGINVTVCCSYIYMDINFTVHIFFGSYIHIDKNVILISVMSQLHLYGYKFYRKYVLLLLYLYGCKCNCILQLYFYGYKFNCM